MKTKIALLSFLSIFTLSIFNIKPVFVNSAHAEESATVVPPVDAPATNTPVKRLRPFGQQIATWQKQQLAEEQNYLHKMNTEHRMMAVHPEKGTVESVHPYMSSHTPRLNFDK